MIDQSEFSSDVCAAASQLHELASSCQDRSLSRLLMTRATELLDRSLQQHRPPRLPRLESERSDSNHDAVFA